MEAIYILYFSQVPTQVSILIIGTCQVIIQVVNFQVLGSRYSISSAYALIPLELPGLLLLEGELLVYGAGALAVLLPVEGDSPFI